jgi:hypothetical protein
LENQDNDGDAEVMKVCHEFLASGNADLDSWFNILRMGKSQLRSQEG